VAGAMTSLDKGTQAAAAQAEELAASSEESSQSVKTLQRLIAGFRVENASRVSSAPMSPAPRTAKIEFKGQSPDFDETEQRRSKEPIATAPASSLQSMGSTQPSMIFNDDEDDDFESF
jgi:hypothetical protein